MISDQTDHELEMRQTGLYELHKALGAELVALSGWRLPASYPAGAAAEHLHCRSHASLFDLSYSSQFLLVGKAAAQDLEQLSPSALRELRPGKARYTILTNEQGGIRADMIVANAGDHLFLTTSTPAPEPLFRFIQSQLTSTQLIELRDQALISLQGPLAGEIIGKHIPEVQDLKFMETTEVVCQGIMCRLSRLGLTGEDGFELSIPILHVTDIVKSLLSDDRLLPAGFLAADSLRLEAGFKRFGQDFDARISPIEAQIQWVIQKRRQEEANFPGARKILQELKQGPSRKLVGLMPEGYKPVSKGADILSSEGEKIGLISSSAFGHSLGAPVALGSVAASLAAPDTDVMISDVNGPLSARIVKLPFVPHKYKR